jgi:hypothetical protein
VVFKPLVNFAQTVETIDGYAYLAVLLKLVSHSFYRLIKRTKNVLSVTFTKHPLQEALPMPRVLSSKKSALKPNSLTLPFVNVSVFN